MAHLTQFVA